MKKLIALLILLPSLAYADQVALSFCTVNGETGNIVASAEVYVREHGHLLTPGYTDANGCHETDFYNVPEVAYLEVGVTHRDYMPWYGYPEWNCQIIYPASPPFVNCTSVIRLVPRAMPSTMNLKTGDFR